MHPGMLKFRAMFEDTEGPILIEPASGCPSLVESMAPAIAVLKDRLLEHGALLLRGFHVPNVAEFDHFATTFSNRQYPYLHRSSPREQVTSNVMTATSYPRQLEIPLHSENSYLRSWPLTIAFCCTQPAARGGATPVASLRAVTERVGTALMDKFESLEVEYIRHYHQAVDLPWQNVFQTDRPEQVERYCRENDVRCEWLEAGLLRTSHIAQGVAYHPLKHSRTFFNQAHLFHVSSLGERRAAALEQMFGMARLPRHARFGDGSEIPPAELDQVRQAFLVSRISFPWHPGDVLLLDNMQYCHGRSPFEGTRCVLAALMDPYP